MKFYVYYGGNEYDGLGIIAENKIQALKILQIPIPTCQLSDLHEFDNQEAYEASSLYSTICRN